MSYTSETSIFHFPFHSQDVHAVEVASERALNKINSLYGEIMSPRDSLFDEPNVINNKLYEEHVNDNRQNHFIKSCCSTLRELCIKCDNHISRCLSCNRCKCDKSNAEFRTHTNNESSKNTERSVPRISRKNIKNSPVQCTIPAPFSFCNKNVEWLKARELKISKIKEDINNKIESELKIKVHTKPVPKSTHLPLYNQMIQEKERRKTDRKEECLRILSNAQPFNLHSKSREKAKSSTDLTEEKNSNFKAKPLPKHILSNKLTEKLKNKEEVRRMLMTERAKNMMLRSSLPFSLRFIPRSRSMIDMSSFKKASNKEYSKKNISEITNRLYAKKCKETINSWNEKVKQVDTCKKQNNLSDKQTVSTHRKQLPVAEPMPFLYFPVRMSNAALLREKQIR